MQRDDEIKIKNFVANCKSRLQRILERLEFTEEGVIKDFNTNSLASTPKQAPKKSQVLTPPKTYPESVITDNSIVLKTPKLQNLLKDASIEAPQNFNDLQANFSRVQKLKIYEYAIENTKKMDNNGVEEVAEGEVSLAEIVAEKRREAKRKKRKFRKTKPTRIEEVRALVQLQMQALQQFVENRDGKGATIKTENLDAEWEHRFKQETYTRKPYGDQDRQERNHYKTIGTTKESYTHTDERTCHKNHGQTTKYHENYASSRNRSPERGRSMEKSYKGYTKYTENRKEYDKRSRKRSRSSESNKYRKRSPESNKYQKRYEGERRSAKFYEGGARSAKDYERRRKSSPEYHNSYKEKSRKHHDKYEKSRDSDRYRSSNHHSDSKRDKDYYRGRSKSPQTHRNRNEESCRKSYREKR